MTRAQPGAHWSRVPSLSQLLLAALLRLVAMLVGNAATFLRMRPSCPAGECHTDMSRRSRKAMADATPRTLSAAKSGKLENLKAASHSRSPEGLMLRAHAVRVSKHEAGRTGRRPPLGASPEHAPEQARRDWNSDRKFGSQPELPPESPRATGTRTGTPSGNRRTFTA